MILRNIQLKKVEIDYSYYSKSVRLGCPWCRNDATHKSRVYKTLKSLLFHISDQHKNQGTYYPFTVDEIKDLMQLIALAKQWELLA